MAENNIKKESPLTYKQAVKISEEILTAGQLSADLNYHNFMSRIKEGSEKITVKGNFHSQVEQIDKLLKDDRTGIVNTILEFMISSATVPFSIVTENKSASKKLNSWAKNTLNKNIAMDIPVGLLALSDQYFRERYRSSFIVLNVIWGEVDGMTLPTRMFFSNGGAIQVQKPNNSLNKKVYKIKSGNKLRPLKETDKKSIIIRKPFNLWHEDYPTPYLVLKGVLFNALLKMSFQSKQAEILEEIIPYLLLLRAGDKNLIDKKLLGDLEVKLTQLKDSLKTAKSNKKKRSIPGDSILKARYDVEVDHLIPELKRIFDATLVKSINNDMLFGLGMVELQGFSSTRTEAILNPKVLIEEIVDSVEDLQALYEDVLRLIIEKNKSKNKKIDSKPIRLVPGVIKSTISDNVKKLIKNFADTGLISIEDAYQALPMGFDFEVNKARRKQEKEDGTEELMFPRVILNQNSDDWDGIAPKQNTTPQETPKD